ncbi:MAG TPA: hypothetical protein VFJ85_13660 [Acidimicrobiales bacterium]|nr:hypothetical protein [Acidimicrobiales bacterium]
MTIARRRLGALALAAAFSALLAACGGGGGSSAPAAPPGANVDPNSGNVITGPINKAKDVAGEQESHDQSEEQQIDGLQR